MERQGMMGRLCETEKSPERSIGITSREVDKKEEEGKEKNAPIMTHGTREIPSRL
jgi:hypothetical protein